MRSVEAAVWSDARWPGVAYAAAGIGLGAGAGGMAGTTAGATVLAVGGRALGRAGTAVGRALASGDLEEARSLLPALVGRDAAGLDEKEMARAVVESVSEGRRGWSVMAAQRKPQSSRAIAMFVTVVRLPCSVRWR